MWLFSLCAYAFTYLAKAIDEKKKHWLLRHRSRGNREAEGFIDFAPPNICFCYMAAASLAWLSVSPSPPSLHPGDASSIPHCAMEAC